MAKTKDVQHIPQTGDEFTPEWFTEVIGPAHQAHVVGVDRTVIGTGIGFLGELHRCALTWDRADEALPASMVVKIPSKNDANRSVGEGLMAYEREIIAYRELGDSMGLPMPAHYYSAMDPDPVPWLERAILFLLEKLPVRGVNWLTLKFLALSGKSKRRYLLVMEDIHDARPPSQVAGGSIDDALRALDTLARFHAHHWMSPRAGEASHRIWPIDRVPKVWQASYLRNRDEFVAQFGDLVGDEMVARLDEAQEQVPDLLHGLAAEPWTLVHGDYRLDNIMYRPGGDLTVLDYQLLALGRPGWDVAYFITTALEPSHRAEEERMLRHYHEALVAAGVPDYSFEQLVADCDTTKLLLAHRMVGSIDTLETEIADGDADTFVGLLVQRVVGWL